MNSAILDHPEVDRLIQLALDEDGVQNDLTTAAAGFASSQNKQTRATIVAKKTAVVAGGPLVERILKLAHVDATIKASTLVADGTTLNANSPWLIFEGRATDLLRVERTILNFLIRMSGIATYTASVVKTLEGTNCKLLHTRKTAPGHRRTDIYATLAGGALPHRRSLDDAVLVKENHLRIASSFQTLTDGINKYRDQASFVEIEVTDFVELKHALGAKPNRIMLDNFSLKDIEKAVNLFSGAVELEASGNITLTNAHEYAQTGVDFISMGSLTHSAPAADLSMLFDLPRG
jgi:nicotinate-nucleotide pyrophosphorylase (carboxylating)